MSLFEHMCGVCNYYMPLAPTASSVKTEDSDVKPVTVYERVCKNCSNKVPEKEGLVMEVVFQDEASESHRIFVNEFTKMDPRLPHTSILKCPNETCPSRTQPGVKSDIIYMKYDATNMKFLYLCNIPGCNTQWKSRS